jgi:predicted Zn-ribbon and HTH transcriptional regulator
MRVLLASILISIVFLHEGGVGNSAVCSSDHANHDFVVEPHVISQGIFYNEEAATINCRDCPLRNQRVVRFVGRITGHASEWKVVSKWECKHEVYDVDPKVSRTVYTSANIVSSLLHGLIAHEPAPGIPHELHPATCKRCGYVFTMEALIEEQYVNQTAVRLLRGYKRWEEDEYQPTTTKVHHSIVEWKDH